MNLRLTAVAAALLLTTLTACGSNEDSPDTAEVTPTITAATTQSMTSSTPAPASASTVLESAAQIVEPAPVTEQIYTTTVAEAPEPYIVSCQLGLGPVATYWSDGTVTGYTDYCQSEHDQILRAEVEANTPTCDGTVCRYPSGATVPDNRSVTTVRKPSPWVQGQIDWQNCIEAGNSQEYCRLNTN